MSNMATLKCVPQTFQVVDFNDLDDFIRKVTGIKTYDFMSDEEGPKDNYHRIHVDGKVDKYEAQEYKKFLQGKKSSSFMTRTILNSLCQEKIILPGDYLIACFW